ncbi:DUF6352 family protein [Acidimangrovimonas pyrenivorans]|uniref:DUF6352 family protein n=1 Tax=Acidimangrovimonas pyrenivorans TaxID=2030798 RepID=A0ABV7AJM0_9RHOB
MIWKSAGLHLTERLGNGWLAVSPDFLRAYYTRPEIHPVAESCAAEHALFERLMETPDAAVTEADLAAIADRDTAANYALVLRFRDHLLAAGSIEAGYRGLFLPAAPQVPPLFIGQLAHLIMANLLTGETDAVTARAGELFFRDQVAMTDEGQLMLADAEVVETSAQPGAQPGALLDPGRPMREVALDKLTPQNADAYWPRADRFDFALDFRFAEPGQDAFARLIERWLAHFLDLPVRVQPLQSVQNQSWPWHVGLDAEATRILNALYQGAELPEAGQGRIAALFRMEIEAPERVIERLRGKPVFLGLAVEAGGKVRMKPQNLLVNLPLVEARQ